MYFLASLLAVWSFSFSEPPILRSQLTEGTYCATHESNATGMASLLYGSSSYLFKIIIFIIISFGPTSLPTRSMHVLSLWSFLCWTEHISFHNL